MSHTDRLRKVPKAFRRLTGITPAAFDNRLAQLTPRHEQAEARRKTRPGRRKPGGGRRARARASGRLLMLLISYRTAVTHAFLGFLFGIDDSAVGRNINPLQPLLAGIFRIPERRIERAADEIRVLFFDATERPTRGQRGFDSGKTKRHTIKAQVVVVRKRKPPGPGVRPRRLRIAAVSESFPGRVHDKKVSDAARVVAPPDAKRTGPRQTSGPPWRRRHGSRVGAS